MYSFSSTGIDNFIADTVLAAEKICGNNIIAHSVTNAIANYLYTLRAPIDFAKALLTCDPSDIASVCLKGGSDDDIIRNIKRFVKLNAK